MRLVRADVFATQHERHGVPRVRSHRRGRRVVAGHDQHVRTQRDQRGNRRIEVLNRLLLAREIAILAGGVRVLVVQEEEVVLVPMAAQRLDLRGEGVARAEDIHADEACEPAVHRIHRDGGGAQLPQFRELRKIRAHRPAAQRQVVGSVAIREEYARLLHEALSKLGGTLRCGVERLHRGHRHALALRVGLVECIVQPVAAKHEHKAVIFHRAHEQLNARKCDSGLQLRADLSGDLGRDATRAAVGDQSSRIDSAEVAARREVGWAQREVDPGRLQHASTHLERERVVAEQREVARAGAGGDAVADGKRLPNRALLGEPVEMARTCFLKLSAASGTGQPTQAVHDAQQHLGLRGNGETANQAEVHVWLPYRCRRDGRECPGHRCMVC